MEATPCAVQSWAGLVSAAAARRTRVRSRSMPVASGQKEDGVRGPRGTLAWLASNA